MGTLSLHAMFELRSALLNGSILLDTQAVTVADVITAIVDDMVATQGLSSEQRNNVREIAQ